MRTKSTEYILTIALLLGCALPALAASDDEAAAAARLEQERQEAFQNGFATIVESLNLGTLELFTKSVDRDDFFDRVFGLRLIDPDVKKRFIERVQQNFEGVLAGGFRDSTEGIKATLLGIESRGDQGRAVVRYDLPQLQFSYHVYELRLGEKNRVIIVDWVDYLQGERFTEGLGTAMVAAAPGRPAARKLLDNPNVKDSDLFQFTELLKAARDRNAKRFVDIVNNLSPELQRQKIVVLTATQMAKQIRNRRMLRQSLVHMAEHFPEEPLFSLMLLDYYVPSKMFEEAIAGLQRTYESFGFDDAAMEARISALTLAMENTADANAYAERAVTLEPGLELAWWSALRARVAGGDFAGSVEALQKLEEQHGHILGAPELQRDKSFADLLASAEFAAWDAARE